MRKSSLVFLLLSAFLSVSAQSPNIMVEINTKIGLIKVELFSDIAPITCANFINYVKNNKYSGSNFYRVVRMDNQPNNIIKIEVIQGGLGFDVEEGDYAAIKHETTLETGIRHTDGVISMARDLPGSASSEFFICIGDQLALDYGGMRNADGQGFAAFGKVIEGMSLVKKIQNMPDKEQMLLNPVEIYSMTVLE